MLIDSHVHVISTDSSRYPIANQPRGEYHVTVENLLEEMDAAGVDRAVLVQPSYYGYDNSYHSDSAAIGNRFVGIAEVDPLEDKGPSTLRYWVTQRGMRGFRWSPLRSAEAGSWLSAKRSGPMMKTLSDLGTPLCVLGAQNYFSRLKELAQEFPEVSIVIEHLGASSQLLPPTSETTAALLALAEHANVYGKITSINLEGENHDPDMLRSVTEHFGPGRLMWGSNYPATAGKYQELVSLGLSGFPWMSDESRGQILGGTATALWPELAKTG